MSQPSAANAAPASILDWFERQATSTPAAIAVVDGDTSLDYTGLAQRVDALARGLVAQGVVPGDRVALRLPRSIDAVVAMLGVWRAGAGYLPLDVKNPPARVEYMLDNATARLVLTTEKLLADRASFGATTVPFVDIAEVESNGAGVNSPLPSPAPDAPAYVIYTSGSTGTPKGVQISHRAACHYVTWAAGYYVGGMAVDMPLYSSLAFDLTVTSLYVPLVTGGRVVVYPESDGPRDLAIYRVLRDDAVDMVKLTPSHLALIARLDLAGARIRKLIVGGEDLTAALAQRVHGAFAGEIEIYNEYGPTEATVGCMEYRFDPERDRAGSVPIGRAIDGTEILVLDDAGRAVAGGGTGEIFIGGASLADGYVNQPEATAERFVAHPARPGARVYRTGDLARRREDGLLEYAGRADRQVKLGGFRVELGEVEAALADHPGITAAAVTLHQPTPAREEIFHCVRCALPSNYPGVNYDADGLCNVCRDYDAHKHLAENYFRTMDELQALLEDAKASRRGDYDVLMLLSGGKDSSYVLYQLLGMGLKVLAYTLDNGYISDGAKDNVRRVVSALGVDHVFGTTAVMDDIFRNSLEQFSNVCNGCFKTLYTLSMQLAHDKGIKYIVTGLSRGQLFETRFDFLLRNRIFDVDAIERDVQRARRIYHAQNDIVSRNLPLGPIADPKVLEETVFIDFYRYSDVGRNEIMGFLESCRNWTRPADTGRSTNCLINDVGIFVHNRERGFHNYALPYCWEVRLGLLDREEALLELATDVNMENVEDILSRIRYTSSDEFRRAEPRLVAYLACDREVSPESLRAHAATRLPTYMVPAQFVTLPELPLTVNGKIDWAALPAPRSEDTPRRSESRATLDAVERSVAEIWERLLGSGGFDSEEGFFDVGGTSMLAVLLYLELEDLVGTELPDPVMTTADGWTIREQATLLRAHGYSA
ncbi:MAG: amino acid adenylation domain-containing protein [Gammaproteobacteria bacterium]